jgi:hypothetical protein
VNYGELLLSEGLGLHELQRDQGKANLNRKKIKVCTATPLYTSAELGRENKEVTNIKTTVSERLLLL